MPFQYGRRQPKNAPALRLATFRSAAPPAHPGHEDYLAKLKNWQMLGNDAAGDCNAVTWANMRRLVTATLTTENYPPQAQVWEFYRTQNPDFDPNGSAGTDGPQSSADNGMDVQTGLEYLHANGGPDGVKALAFAKVDHTNLEEVEAAIAIFGCLWLGIVVLDANQQEFTEGHSWTDVRSSQVDGRHAIVVGGYTRRSIKFVTWAQETEFAKSFWNGSVDGSPLVEEAWVVIWPEHLGSSTFLQGIDQAQLATDYQNLTGKTLTL